MEGAVTTMANEKKKDGRGKRETLLKRNATIAGMTVQEYRKWLDTDRLRRWTKKARQDPAYRAKCAERQRARQRQLVADAEFGRMARTFLDNLGRMLAELANLRKFVVDGGDWSRGKNAAMDGRAQNAKAKGEVV